jgi:hypothetical protein
MAAARPLTKADKLRAQRNRRQHLPPMGCVKSLCFQCWAFLSPPGLVMVGLCVFWGPSTPKTPPKMNLCIEAWILEGISAYGGDSGAYGTGDGAPGGGSFLCNTVIP